jgi:hypothetical protein
LGLVAVGVLAFAAFWSGVALLPIAANDIDAFFWPSARVALEGNPLQIYMPLGQATYGNANGPLAIVPLVAIGEVIKAMGWMDMFTPRRALILAAFSPFLLLMAHEAVAAVDRVRGRPMAVVPRLIAFGAFAMAPLAWESLAGYGHIEQGMEIWLVLLAARWVSDDRPFRAGPALGLAVLARTMAGLFGLPLAIAMWRRGPGRAVVLAATALATTAVGVLPFFLADRSDVVHSLFQYRGALPVGAGSVWNLARGTSIEPLAQHWDLAFVVAVVVAFNIWLAPRRGQNEDSRRLYAALAITAAGFALLAKTVWPYYFLEVYVFTAVWAFSRRPARWWQLAGPPVLVSALAILAEGGVTANLAPELTRLEGSAMFVLVGTAMVALAAVAVWPVSRAISTDETPTRPHPSR